MWKSRQREAETRKGEKSPETWRGEERRGGEGSGFPLPYARHWTPRSKWPVADFALPRVQRSLCAPSAASERRRSPAVPAVRRPPLPPPGLSRSLLPLTASSRGGVGDVVMGAGLPASRALRSGDPSHSLGLDGGLSRPEVGAGLAPHPCDGRSTEEPRGLSPPLPPPSDFRGVQSPRAALDPPPPAPPPPCAASRPRRAASAPRVGLDRFAPMPGRGELSECRWLELWRCPPVASAARTAVAAKFSVLTLQGRL